MRSVRENPRLMKFAEEFNKGKASFNFFKTSNKTFEDIHKVKLSTQKLNYKKKNFFIYLFKYLLQLKKPELIN
jgi:hypothetical protein